MQKYRIEVIDERELISKDKIKAKIEEVNSGTYDAKIVLQSLLEEEKTMSDEERIEQLELENKVLQDNNKGLKDKIDEQSKEIEEYKKQLDLDNECEIALNSKVMDLEKEIEELKDTRSIFNMGRRSYKNEIEDKIKAKIEEIDKEYSNKILSNEKMSLDFININTQRHNAMKLVLEELLEKEFPTTITKEELEKRWKE